MPTLVDCIKLFLLTGSLLMGLVFIQLMWNWIEEAYEDYRWHADFRRAHQRDKR